MHGRGDHHRGTGIDDQLGTIDGEALNLTRPRRIGGKRVGYPVGEALRHLVARNGHIDHHRRRTGRGNLLQWCQPKERLCRGHEVVARERQQRITVERDDFDRRQHDRGTEDVRDHEVILDVLQAVAAGDTDGTANRRDDDRRELPIRGLAGWGGLLGGDRNETGRGEDEGHGNDGTATQGPLLCRTRLAATGQAPARGIPPRSPTRTL